jgi:multidrug efflux pump subunit AcrA (membrane-fusion protein)
MQNGGVEALTTMLAREGGEDEFYALLRNAGIAEDIITQIQENGGPQALAEVLARFGAGPLGQAPAATGQAADQTAANSVESPSIRLGMTADVEIVVSMQENVLVVPTSAIQRDTQGEYLLVDDGSGGQTRVAVTSGVTRSGMTVIDGDVTEGQVVYIPVTSDSSSSSSGLRPGGGMGLLTGGGMPGGAPPAGGPGGQ